MHVITYAVSQYVWELVATPVHKCNLVTGELDGDRRRMLHCLGLETSLCSNLLSTGRNQRKLSTAHEHICQILKIVEDTRSYMHSMKSNYKSFLSIKSHTQIEMKANQNKQD